ncbi:MAG TPA: cyclase family protein [Clostridiaceae bacterium]|nr:cyclase family protein [Clostridiaceae bacterium]
MIIDLTKELWSGMAVYEGDPGVVLESFKTVEEDGYALTRLQLSTHSGTHMDAPSHFYRDGKTITEISLDKLMGRAVVLGSFDEALPEGITIVLARKGFLSLQRAEELLESGAQVFGTVHDSIEESTDAKGMDAFPVHQLLLGREAVIIENLDMTEAEEKTYGFVALPLRIRNGDGSPARVVLTDDLYRDRKVHP